jgi:hypothetical protein
MDNAEFLTPNAYPDPYSVGYMALLECARQCSTEEESSVLILGTLREDGVELLAPSQAPHGVSAVWRAYGLTAAELREGFQHSGNPEDIYLAALLDILELADLHP